MRHKFQSLLLIAALAASLLLTGATPVQAAPGSVTTSLTASSPIPCDGATAVTLTVDGVSPPPSQVPVDVVLVLDRSGSMVGAPIANLRTAANTFVDDMDGSDGTIDGIITASRLGEVSFADAPSTDVGLTTYAAAVHAKINSLVAGGITNLGGAVATATNMLYGGTAKDVMVVMTDGQSNTGPDPLVTANNAKAMGIEVFTIGLGIGINEPQLKAMATDASHYFNAPTSVQLASIFHVIATGVAGPAGTELSYSVQPAPGFAITGGSADVGTITTVADSLTWTLPELRTETARITYTLQHTAATGGTVPIHATAAFTYKDGDGTVRTVNYGAVTVEVQGCNQPPVAKAGPDQTVPQGADGLATVTLDGTASVDDGQLQPLAYTWSEGSVTLGSGATLTHAFGLGYHLIALTVDDGQYASSATVTIIVNDPFPPATAATLSGTAGENGWYTSPVSVALSAGDNPGGSGVAGTFIALDGGAFAAYGGPLTITGDGAHTVQFYSQDLAGNVEALNQADLKIDTTAPAITVASPLGQVYPDDAALTIDWTAADAVSGIALEAAVLDGAPVADGSAIDLSTLTLGKHLFAVTATDEAGNPASTEVRFQIQVTYDSLAALKHRFAEAGLIKNQGIVTSLDQKLRAAQSAHDRGQFTTEDNILGAFIAQVQAQAGKGILEPAVTILLRDAQWLMDHN